MNAFVRDGSIVFIILNDGMILASDRQHDALVPDLAPQRIRDELELLQLPLHALELVGEGDRRVEPLRGLFVHGLGNFHDITHVEGHVLGPDRPADESADDIEEHVLLEILGPINLESFLLVDDDGQDSGEYVLNPFVSWAEVEAEHLDDAIGILGDGEDFILARCSLVVQDDISTVGDHPGLGELGFVDEDEAEHDDFICYC